MSTLAKEQDMNTVVETVENRPFSRPPSPVKWLGSKLSQSGIIVSAMPPVHEIPGRYLEPFVGGGYIWMSYGHNRNVINDSDADLMNFWSMSDADFRVFRNVIESIESARTRGGCSLENFREQAMMAIRDLHPDIDISSASRIIAGEYFRREKAIEKHGIDPENVEGIRRITNTGVNAVIYYICRDAWNRHHDEPSPVRAALWLVIRELAYGGIFRLNPLGGMNMSYGGVSYDTKDIMSKVEILEKIRNTDTYMNTEFRSEDFRDFFAQQMPDGRDFLFLDPPFTGEFFSMEDQRDLHALIAASGSQAMITLSGSDTPVIDLYRACGWQEVQCDRTGTGVSIRGRIRKRNQITILTNY